MCGAHHWGESNGWEVVDWNAAVSCHHLEEAPRLEGVTIVGEHVCGGKEQGDCRHLPHAGPVTLNKRSSLIASKAASQQGGEAAIGCPQKE